MAELLVLQDTVTKLWHVVERPAGAAASFAWKPDDHSPAFKTKEEADAHWLQERARRGNVTP